MRGKPRDLDSLKRIPLFQVNASFLANTNGSQQKHLTVKISKGSVHTVLICRLSIESITENQENIQNPPRNVPHVRFICVRIILLIIITKIYDYRDTYFFCRTLQVHLRRTLLHHHHHTVHAKVEQYRYESASACPQCQRKYQSFSLLK